jgi:hypothetical protein
MSEVLCAAVFQQFLAGLHTEYTGWWDESLMTLLVESDHLVEDTDFSLLDHGITKIEYPCWRASHLSSLKVVDDGGRDHISPDRFVWSVLVTQIRLQPLHVQLSVCVFVLHTHSHGFSKTLSAYSGSS